MDGDERANRVRERLQRRARAAKGETGAPPQDSVDGSGFDLDPHALIGLLHARSRVAATEIASRIVAEDIAAVFHGEEGGEGFYAFHARPYDDTVMRCVPGLGIGVTSHYTTPKSIDTRLGGGKTGMLVLKRASWGEGGLAGKTHPLSIWFWLEISTGGLIAARR
jgi:hypothetical protein